MLLSILGLALIGSLLSLTAGILLLLWRPKTIERLAHMLASFAAGILLGVAFLDLLPEAAEIHHGLGGGNIFIWTILGFLLFFIMERYLHWFHHHHEHIGPASRPTAALIIVGDTVHNMIDGVVIATAYMANPALGLVTTLGVAAHEVPQEIGDFVLLLKEGLSRTKVLLVNIFSAVATLVAATATYLAGDFVLEYIPVFLALTAGFFIYIAASDLVPDIHRHNRGSFAAWETLLFIAGIASIWGVMALLGDAGHFH